MAKRSRKSPKQAAKPKRHRKRRRPKKEAMGNAAVRERAMFDPDPNGTGRVIVRPKSQAVNRIKGASVYSHEKAMRICERLVAGESMHSITRDADMPSWGTLYDWGRKYPEFNSAVLLARFDQADTYADQAIFIADHTEPGNITTIDGGKMKIVTADMTEHRKMRIETRKWFAGALKPHKYGQRVSVTTPPDETPKVLYGVTFPDPPALPAQTSAALLTPATGGSEVDKPAE